MKASQPYVSNATRLYNLLSTNRRLTVRPKNLTSWIECFRLLQKEISAKRIEQVLDWITKRNNLRNQYTPIINSARSFREKFIAIESAMRRDSDAPAQTIDLEVHPMILEFLEANSFEWPFGEKEKQQEEQFMQRSHNNYMTFRDKLSNLYYADQQADQGFEWGLLDWLEGILNHDGIDFVFGWTRETFQIAHKWDKWDGQLMKWVFRVSSKRWQKDVIAYTREYGMDEFEWQRILTTLGY